MKKEYLCRNKEAKTALFNGYLYLCLLTYKEKQFYNKVESMDNMWLNSRLWSFGMVFQRVTIVKVQTS